MDKSNTTLASEMLSEAKHKLMVKSLIIIAEACVIALLTVALLTR